MATATIARVGDTIKLDGEPQTFALRFTEGKSVASRFPGGRVMFTCIDERKLFMNDEEASEFEHALIEKGIRKAEFISVSRITHGHGGGFAIRVERVEEGRDPDGDRDNAPAWVRDAAPAPRQSREEARAAVPTREEALLEKSVEMARERGAAAFQRTPARISPEPPPAPAHGNNGYSADHTPKPAAAHQLMGAFCAAIDACAAAQEYAVRKGLNVAFTSEDVRACAISIYINTERAALAVRY